MQSAKPSAHDEGKMTHLPAVHSVGPLTCVSAVQSLPHVPHVSSSERSVVQPSPPLLQSANPAAQS